MSCIKGYLFIANTTKPSTEVEASIAPIPIGNFEAASLYAAKELGYKLFMGISRKFPDKIKCANLEYDITYYDEHIYRNIFAIKDNWLAYKNTCHLMDLHPEIKVIHCNTPIGGVIGRIVGKKYKKKVIYMVHGFHFYKGAPLLNWVFFYPLERFLLKYTDSLITINTEDYKRALKYKLRNNGRVYYVPGVGINLGNQNSFWSIPQINIKREELKLPQEAKVIIAVGRLDKNKNYALLVKAVSKMHNRNVHVIICGEGKQRSKLEQLIDKLHLSERVHLLGHRTDVFDLYKISDIFVLSSFREGLSRSIMEAMASGLPCVVTKIRGNTDLIDEGKGGFCINPNDVELFAEALDTLSCDKFMRRRFSTYNLEKVKMFSDLVVKNKMLEIFKEEL